MLTREIAQQDWKDFCDSFSLRHAGWRVSLEVAPAEGRQGASNEAQVMVRDAPLQGVTVDLRGDLEDQASIVVGAHRPDRVTHNVYGLSRVELEQGDDGSDEALRLVGRDGAAAVRFRVPARPDAVDGIEA